MWEQIVFMLQNLFYIFIIKISGFNLEDLSKQTQDQQLLQKLSKAKHNLIEELQRKHLKKDSQIPNQRMEQKQPHFSPQNSEDHDSPPSPNKNIIPNELTNGENQKNTINEFKENKRIIEELKSELANKKLLTFFEIQELLIEEKKKSQQQISQINNLKQKVVVLEEGEKNRNDKLNESLEKQSQMQKTINRLKNQQIKILEKINEYAKPGKIYIKDKLTGINTYKNFIQLFQQYSDFTRVDTIDISLRKITTLCMKVIAENSLKFPNLKTIFLCSDQITGQGLKTLVENSQKFLNLQHIWLTNNWITDEGLEALAENSAKFNSLKQIDLSQNKITDAGLKALLENNSKFPNLQLINLSYNSITDKGLNALLDKSQKFPSLQNIQLYNNKISNQCRDKVAEMGLKFTVSC